ncbi:MAG TPA: peptidase S10 [Candidatus Angelobacter sp.]|nr:peptidase S10 [Candidatus Angelobacter sp.]
MMLCRVVSVFAFVVFTSLLASGQQRDRQGQQPAVSPSATPAATGEGGARPAAEAKKDAKEAPEVPPVVTHHEIRAGGKTLRYTATAGMMPLKNLDSGEVEAHIFYIAYTLDGQDPARRPLTFSFNGGPGSASVWLHLGAIGPKRVRMQPDGMMPAPPYQLVDNEYTWLDQTDLAFIDPVGTGYSRAVKRDQTRKFLGLRGDIESVGEFIRLYLGRYERWSSPLFLVGESYGTTRAAGLSGYLVDHGIAFNGIMLISSILNFETTDFAPGNDLPYVLFLPTYADTAWYHKKQPPDLLKDFAKMRAEVEQWVATGYAEALAKGDRLSPQERSEAADKLARYTGLSKSYVEQSNLRIDEPHFVKELLRDQNKTVGRLDSRFTGSERSQIAETARYDPSMSAIRPPYTAMFNQYVRTELGYKSDLEYYILGGGFRPDEWDWGVQRGGFPDTAQALKDAFDKNPFMKLFVGSGYYDLATPYFATQYTLNHMALDKDQHARVGLGYYGAGHMMYIQDSSLGELKKDIGAFMQGAMK